MVETAAQWSSPRLGFALDPTVARLILASGAVIGAVALVWSSVSHALAWPLRSVDPNQLADAIAPSTPQRRTRILAVTGDEAGLALGIGQSLTYAGQKTRELTTRTFANALWSLAPLMLANVVLSIGDVAERIPSDYVLGLEVVEAAMTLFVRPLAVVAVALFLVEGAGSMATGWDGMGLPLGHVSIALTPVGHHEVLMVLPHDDTRRPPMWHYPYWMKVDRSELRHAQLMERSDVIARVVSAVVHRQGDGWAFPSSE